jgi:hypothetical protein
MIAASAMQAVGAIQQGKSAQAQARANATAANYNANLRTMEAGIARQNAGRREEQQRRAARQILGKQRAAIAQSGTLMTGSNIDITEQSEFNAELDALNIRYEGDLRSYGLLAQAEQDRYAARSYEAAGKNAMTGAYLSAGASLLSGAASASTYSAKLAGTGGFTSSDLSYLAQPGRQQIGYTPF